MSANWLAAVSFQQSQEVLHSINTLSIHTKLSLRGISDDERTNKVKESKHYLMNFLKDLDSLVQDIKRDKEGPITGINPRLGQLARKFISSVRKRKHFQELVSRSPQDVVRLINSEDKKDQRVLLKCLAELRLLVEHHIYSDANQILGKF